LPIVESCSKSGAVSPRRMVIVFSKKVSSKSQSHDHATNVDENPSWKRIEAYAKT